VGSEFANWFLNLWAHQTLLDGCDCLFAMEMLKANEAEGEGRISWGQYHGDNIMGTMGEHEVLKI